MTRWELEWMIELAAAYLHAQEGKSILYLDQGLILARSVEDEKSCSTACHTNGSDTSTIPREETSP
jgi:hypothetical protein